jgi:release factor glutamine methyltransferase
MRLGTKKADPVASGVKVYTIGEVLQRAGQHLQHKGVENARLNADMLLGAILNLSRIDLYLNFDRPLTDEDLSAFRNMIRGRLGGQPLQYLTGSTEFYSLTLQVNPAALIPRPETEILVDVLLERLRLEQRIPLVADVGTGCGNIAIALAVHLPEARLWATDHSFEALALARENARRHGVEDRIHCVHGDLLEPLGELKGRLTAVVSNPPYVPTDDLDGLPVEIRKHEPLVALDGGKDGLEIIRRVVTEASKMLASEGWLALEIGAGQAQAVEQLIAQVNGAYRKATIIPDYAGIPRVILTRKR